MAKKIQPTGRQKSFLLLHCVVFVIGVAVMWSTYSIGVKGWAYPWPAWTTAAWSLLLLGHFCLTFTSYQDKGWAEYQNQQEGQQQA